MSIGRPRGTNDILPGESRRWQFVEAAIRRICRCYGYEEIRTPMFEHTELFQRGIGETTDIVEKEMYTFVDRGSRSLTLRPEGTAPVVRSFLEHKLYGGPLPVKLFYLGPMFRYERPQAGRYRQFSQFGVEVFGTQDPALDAEVITMPIHVYEELGLQGFEVHIGSLGCPVCRPPYRQVLQEYLLPRIDELCSSCRDRVHRNPMRVLDCKVPGCQSAAADAPLLNDHLCGECRDHFAAVQECLQLLAVDTVVNPRLVRGFDYYTKTVFEIKVPSLGAQDAVGGGGRYDGLVAEMGGPSVPGIGFGVGMERVLLALEQEGRRDLAASSLDGYIAQFGGETKKAALRLAYRLRKAGLAVDMDYMGRSLKAQMKAAGRAGVSWVIILGTEELIGGKVKVRWMASGEEDLVPLDDAADYLTAGKGGPQR